MVKKFIPIIFAAIFIISCAANFSEENLIGRWQVTDFETDAAETLAMIDVRKADVLKNRFILSSNGSYTQETIGEGTFKGGWYIDQEKQAIFFSDVEMSVDFFSYDKMIWIEKGDDWYNKYTLERVE